jgi:hypothetical protein
VRLAAQLKPLPEFQDRQAKRSRVSLEARMRELGTTGYDVHLLDVSTHGFKAERRDHFSAGAYVWLKVPGFPGLNARIAWVDSYRLGCEFIAQIDASDVARMVEMSEQDED